MLLSLEVGIWISSLHLCMPYGLSTTFSALSFYGIGNILRQVLLRPSNKSLHQILFVGIFLFAIYFSVTYFIGRAIIMSTNNLKLVDIVPSFLGIFSLLFLSKAISIIPIRGIGKDLVWLGHNTLVIMATHQLFIALSYEYILPLLHHGIVYKIVEQVFVWTLCLAFVYLINHYAKWILGK